MQPSSHPFTRDLVLVGGGHTHALVLRSWTMAPLPGARLTVINPAPTAAYSGMLPGHIAGHYDKDALEIDLVRLARFAGARLVLGTATGLDIRNKQVLMDGHPAICFDVASIDIGITTQMPSIPGVSDHAVAAKPLDRLAEAWRTYLNGTGPADVAVIGAGVAGVELALAMAHALGQRNRACRIHLIERGRVLSALRAPAARRLRAALTAADITIHEQARVMAVTANGVRLETHEIAAGFVCGAAGAMPHDWLRTTGLTHENGFLTVDERLRTSCPDIFAVGDCAHMGFAPRPKAGVFAVRQTPTLAHNLRAALRETGPFRRYKPQKDYLKLISMGGKSAIGDRFGLTFSGPWVWRWKDRIDRKFMEKLKVLRQELPPPPPFPRAAGTDELEAKVLCGGCGAKLGQGALGEALGEHLLPGDDAAVIELAGRRSVISTDHLREMVADPVAMTRITAQHALGDIWAMGATPQSVVANVILPRMSRRLAARTLGEIMQTAREVMTAAGAEIVGGHSSQGAELTIGFTITGDCPEMPIQLSNAKHGDSLILTKPLGSGVIMAADMAGKARGTEVQTALQFMSLSQQTAAHLLRHAHAMTDVTGFGLLGHLRNICLNSNVGAELSLEEIPFLPGAIRLAETGVRSSLFPDNRAPFPDLQDSARHDLLVDPQTSGGLLASVPGEPADVLMRLKADGHQAAIIGRITENAGQIDIR
jgi:selenide,water dikinase